MCSSARHSLAVVRQVEDLMFWECDRVRSVACIMNSFHTQPARHLQGGAEGGAVTCFRMCMVWYVLRISPIQYVRRRFHKKLTSARENYNTSMRGGALLSGSVRLLCATPSTLPYAPLPASMPEGADTLMISSSPPSAM